MNISTHQKISPELCGKPVMLAEGESHVELHTIDKMSVDDKGLVHGGFVFGLADYAAMIAVNDPNVVLGAAEVKFSKPVKIGETILARAKADVNEGRKRIVSVTVERKGEPVFSGTFVCFVLEKHVLD